MSSTKTKAAKARAKLAGNSERVKEAAAQAEQLEMWRRLFWAHLRAMGRVRISQEDLDLLHEDDRVDFQPLGLEGRDGVVITFVSGRPKAG